MAGSVVVACKKALVALLAARPGLDGVQVAYSWPGDDLVERERVFMGRARGDHTPDGLKAGRTFRNERATFDVEIQVEKVGGTPEEAEERASAIGKELEECVADNRTLGGVIGLNWAVMSSWTSTVLYNDKGSLAAMTYTIRYAARLT